MKSQTQYVDISSTLINEIYDACLFALREQSVLIESEAPLIAASDKTIVELRDAEQAQLTYSPPIWGLLVTSHYAPMKARYK